MAQKVGQSKAWATVGCLSQMTCSAVQAKTIADIFDLTTEENKWLQVVPDKGSLPTPVPTDPLLTRWSY